MFWADPSLFYGDMAETRLRPMRSPAPVPLRRPGFRELRHPLPRVKPPVPRPAPPDEPQSPGLQAATAAFFPSTASAETAASTAITRPPARPRGGTRDRRLAAPEWELLAALLLSFLLSAAALVYGRITTGALAATDLLLAGAVLLSGLGLLVLGF